MTNINDAMSHETRWMDLAISLARSAGNKSEVPVGAIIVSENKLISTGFNLRESSLKATAHAEIIAIEEASKRLRRWRLHDCELYVTLEPCLMCAGALHQSRIKRVVYGCRDPKGGALGSLYEINKDERLNHRFEVTEGLRSNECSQLLSSFFAARRKNSTR